MSACAERSPHLVLPQHPRTVEFDVRAGDAVSTVDGEPLGTVEAVDAVDIRIRDGAGYLYTVSREDVFWSDERGVVIARSLAEVLAAASEEAR